MNRIRYLAPSAEFDTVTSSLYRPRPHTHNITFPYYTCVCIAALTKPINALPLNIQPYYRLNNKLATLYYTLLIGINYQEIYRQQTEKSKQTSIAPWRLTIYLTAAWSVAYNKNTRYAWKTSYFNPHKFLMETQTRQKHPIKLFRWRWRRCEEEKGEERREQNRTWHWYLMNYWCIMSAVQQNVKRGSMLVAFSNYRSTLSNFECKEKKNKLRGIENENISITSG